MDAEGAAARSRAEQVYKRLLESTENARTRNNLQILWAALEKMRLDEVPDYNAARVGKYSAELGGIRAQSIRNANGFRFRELIDAYANTVGKSRSKVPVRPPSNVDLALDKVTDIGVRTTLKMMLADRRRLLDENNRLRSAFKKLAVVTADLGKEEAPDSQQASEVLPPIRARETVDDILLAAVEKFLSDDWLEKRAWIIEPDGSIVDNAIVGDLVAPPGFVDALRQLVLKQSRHEGQTETADNRPYQLQNPDPSK